MAAITGIVVGPDYMPRFPQESCAESEQGKRAALGNFTRLSPIVTCRAPHAHGARRIANLQAACAEGGVIVTWSRAYMIFTSLLARVS